jgi:ABC-2 type transport system permease protein
MTASTISADRVSASGTTTPRLRGFRPLFRKDIGEWLHGKRPWVIAIVATLFTAVAAANNALLVLLNANLGEGEDGPAVPTTVDPLENLLAGAAFPTFILAAVFVAMSLIVVERQTGTLSWIASKPVSRAAIWLSKWASASLMLAITAAIVPVAITAGLVTVLYGAPPVLPVATTAIGIAASAAFFVAVVLAASTFVPSQAAAAAIGFAVYFLPSMLGMLVPFPLDPFLPSSILNWSIGLSMGADVGFVTPIAWVVSIVVLAALSARRMERMEL